MNTETKNPPKRTPQEIAELYAARKRYRASPEGQKANAEAARLMAIAKAADEPAMRDYERIEELSKLRREERQRAENAEAESARIAADAQQFAEEVAQRDQERRQELRELEFEKSRLANLASSTPRDFARELGRSENYITEMAKELGLQKTAGRWVFIQGDAQRNPKKLYDYLTGKMRNGFTAP